MARLDEPLRPRLRIHRRPATVLATALALALAVPALALSGALGSLFGFSNQGTSVDTSKLDLGTVGALNIAGVKPGTLKLLASREGVGYLCGARRSRESLLLQRRAAATERAWP